MQIIKKFKTKKCFNPVINLLNTVSTLPISTVYMAIIAG